MLKKIRKIAIAIFMTVVTSLTALVGCDRNSSSQEISFWYYGSTVENQMYKTLAEKFNETYGKEHNIKVIPTSKPINSYLTAVRASASSKSGPDVFLENDDNFKRNIGNGLTGALNDELNSVTDIDVSDIWQATANRYRYNAETNTSNDDDDVYGYVVDSRPTALYYNESLFEKAGITVISVDEADMDKWNNNEIADQRGKKKSDYSSIPQNMNIPKKGYFRSTSPYLNDVWSIPQGEVLVFNNRIPMNWDEIEDLAMLFTPKYNKKALDDWNCSYGFFTEWWFMYVWGIGGDCLSKINDKYNYSLLDDTKNYIVSEGKEYIGKYSGTTYKSGDILSFEDKNDVKKTDAITADGRGDYYINNNLVKNRDFAQEIENGTLKQLPSAREAFTRYLRLGAKTTANFGSYGNGLQISPNPNVFTNGKTAVNYFISGELAMLVTYSSYMAEIVEASSSNNFKWDIAPTLQYKQYNDPYNPNDDTIKVKGIQASQSNTFGLVCRRKSEKKAASAAFIKWMASKEAQSLKASFGFFPNQAELIDSLKFSSNKAPNNVKLFFDSVQWERYGDWRYLKDYVWIDMWAVPLNDKVRNGTLSYSQWIDDVVATTNKLLENY